MKMTKTSNKKVHSCRHNRFKSLALLTVLLLAVITAVTSCGGGGSGEVGSGGGIGGVIDNIFGNGTEPVYTGMSISSEKGASDLALPSYDLLALGAYNPWTGPVVAAPGDETGPHKDPKPEHDSTHDHDHVHGDLPGKEADQEDPFDQVEGTGQSNEDILQDKVESSLEIVGAAKPIYYAEKGQDIYITVHIDNPDNYEILSFTLNGNKYSSYMFEDGSDMENLILKVNVGDVEGVQEYTIDAIKYVDGTDIKDVRMDGDKTVRAGVATDKQPLPAISAEVINFNDVSFDVSIDDQLSLIAHSEGKIMAVLYDGDKVVDMKELALGEQTSVKFEGLTTNSLYQYAIVAYYDSLDSNGAAIHVLNTKAFYTRAILLFNNVVLGTETADYELVWADDAPDKTLQSLVLESAFDGKVSLSVDTLHIEKLRSEADYTLTATYLNGGNEEQVSISFRTYAKQAPVLSMNETSKGQHELSFSLDFADPNGIAKLERLQLISDKAGSKDIPVDTRSLSDLLSNTSYTIKATYSYDLNDGEGLHVEEQELVIHTNEKTVPKVTLTEASSAQTAFSFNLALTDPDGIATLTKLELLSSKTDTAEFATDTRSFDGLLTNTAYTVKVTYTYDLGDGNGMHEETATLVVKTKARAIPKVTLTQTSKGQEELAFDLYTIDPDGLFVMTKLELLSSKTETVEFPIDTRSFAGLLSNTAYTIKATYTYDLGDGNGVHEEYATLVIKTNAKTAPMVTLSQVSKGQEDLSFDLFYIDPDGLYTMTKLELLSDKTDTIEAALDARSFSGLLSDTAYTVRVTYTYDLNDGNGLQEATADLVIKTDAKTVPTFQLTAQDKTHDTITVTTTATDPDGIAQITDLSVFLDGELVASSDTFDQAIFEGLISNTTYTVVLTYEYDLNDGNGVITEQVEITVLTLVLFYPVSAEIGNTSAVSEGEYVFIDVTVVNPNGAVINSVRINGKDYPASPTSEEEIVRVQILHEKQFEGGLTDFVVESLTATTNGETHTYALKENNVATVFINGELIVESIGVVNDKGELLDYAFPSDFIGLYVALSNKTGYDIDQITITDNWSQYTYNADQIIMLDQNTVLIPLHDRRSGGYHNYEVTSITYSNFSLSDKQITVETKPYSVLYFDTDDIIQISTPEQLKKMDKWAYYRLANDIDLSGQQWDAPGNFYGYFDGNNYTIKNLTVRTSYNSESKAIGLFNYATGKIFDLNLSGFLVQVQATNTVDNNYYHISYGAIAPSVGDRIILDNVHVDQKVEITTTGNNISASAGHLFSGYSYNCYLSDTVALSGTVVCNGSEMSTTDLGQSISKLPAKPEFDENSDPSLFFDKLVTEGGIKYLCLNNGVAIVIGFDGSVDEVVIGLDGYTINTIPGRIFNKFDNITSVVIPEGVLTIGNEAFANCEKLTSVTLPSTLTSIGYGAFRECYALTAITLPESVKTIGDSAFSSCGSLNTVVLPEGLVSIGEWTFAYCHSLYSIKLPETLNSVGYHAFYGANIRFFVIPASVTEVGENAFSGNNSMIYAYAAKLPTGWSENWNGERTGNVVWGVTGSITDEQGVTYALFADNTAHVIGYTGDGKNITIGLDDYTVTKIAPYAFYECDTLVGITLPEGLSAIGECAFYHCDSLESINIPKGITKIENYTFYNCDALESIVIPEGVTSIGESAFNECDHLTSVTLPDTLVTIGTHAFYNCDLRTLVIPNSVTSIGTYAFAWNNDLSSLTLSSALTKIEESTFQYCERLKSVIIPEGVTSIGNNAFFNCWDMRGVSLPSTLTTIGASAFGNVNLQIVLIPASVTTIDEYAFGNGMIYAFATEAPTGWSKSWNSNRTDSVIWGVQSYTTDQYGVTYVLLADGTATIAGVSGVVSEIVLGGAAGYPVTEIPAYLLNGRTDITKITIHSDITKIGEYAFANGGGRHIVLPITVTEVGDYAFSDNFVYVQTSTKLTGWADAWNGYNDNYVIWSAPAGTFYTDPVYGHTYLLTDDGWAHLYRFEISKELTIAGVEGYQVVVHGGSGTYNDYVKKLTLLDGVVKIDASAFAYFYGLTDLILPASLTEIGEYAFTYTPVKNLILSDSITKIGKEAFTSGNVFVTCAQRPAGWDANWCTSLQIWDYKDIYTDENGISYVLTNGGLACVYDYNRDATEIVIGGVEGYKTVVTNVFRDNDSITKVTLAEGVVEIAANAFYHCSKLAEINFPSTLTTIGDYAFNSCQKLRNINLPEGLETIGAAAFNGGNYRHITIPSTVTKIGENAFSSNYVYVSVASTPDGWAENWYGSKSNVIWSAPKGTFYVDPTYGHTYLLTEDGWAHLYRFNYSNQELTIGGVEGYKVVIHRGSNSGDWNLTKLTLLEGVVKLDEYAFAYYYNMKEVVLPASLEEIGSYAFHENNNLQLTIPTTVLKISESAFTGGMISVIAKEKPAGWHENWYTGSSDNVFWNFKDFYTDAATGITYILTNDGYAYTQSYDNSKSELTINGIEGYKVVVTSIFNGNGSLKKVTFGEGVVEIAANAFYYCEKLSEINFPESLTAIGDEAFRYTALDKVQIPTTVTTMGQYAFNCETIYPMASTKPAGWDDDWFGGNYKNVFWNFKEFYTDETYGVTYVIHNDGTASIYSFEEGEIVDVVIGIEGYTVVGMYPGVFQNSSIESIQLPEGLLLIADNAFYNCQSLATVKIPSTVTSIGRYAFYHCNKLTEVIIPEGVTAIKSLTFYNCYNLKVVKLPSTLTVIEESAFEHCNQLANITLPDSITTIGNGAFQYCYALQITKLPASLTTIGGWAFYNVNSSNVLFIPETVTSIGEHAFTGSVAVSVAKRPAGWSESWFNKDHGYTVVWNVKEIYTDSYGVTYMLKNDQTAIVVGFGNEVSDVVIGVEGYTVTEIAKNAFSGCGNLKSIKLPETLTTIGSHAFYNTAIQTLVIPNSVTKIGEYAFAENGYLTSVTLSTALTVIENNAFRNCHSLQSVAIPEGVTKIGESAFWNCYNLRAISIPSTLQSIGSYAFQHCALSTVLIPDSVTYIGEYVFTSGTVYAIASEKPEDWSSTWNGEDRQDYVAWGVKGYMTDEYGVTYIKFADDSVSIISVSGIVSEIVLGGHEDYPVTEIPARLLYGREDITKVTLAEGITKIGEYAFYGCGSLTEIVFPSTLTEIETYAFANSNRHIFVPTWVTTVGDRAFESNYVYLSTSSVPTGWAVNWYGYSESRIVWNAPAGEFYVDPTYGHTYLLTEDGWAHLYRFNFSNNELTIGGVKGYKVVVHGGSYNGDWNLHKLTLLEGVVKLDEAAFADHYNLKEIVLPTSLEEIGASAFYNCSSSLQLTIPTTVLKVGENAFNQGMISVIAKERPADWHENWYSGSAQNVFWNFKEFYTDAATGITYILTNDGYAYTYSYDSSKSELTIGGIEGYKVVVTNIFNYNDNIKKVTLGEGVVEIAEKAFYDCDYLEEINFPESLTAIGARAFRYTALNEIKIPTTVTKMGEHAFWCDSIYPMASTKPAGWSDNWFGGDHMYVFWNFKEFYTDETYGVTYVIHNDGTASIYSFEQGEIVDVVIGIEGYTVVGMYPGVFRNTAIESIQLPEGLLLIADNAFYNCQSLVTVKIPSTVTSIGREAFYHCNKLTEVTIPEGVTVIKSLTFYNCYNLKVVKLPSTLTVIEDSAFEHCNQLAKINLPDSITTIGNGAFQYCYALQITKLPASLTTVGSWAFYHINSSNVLFIPETITSISENAFTCSVAVSVAKRPEGWAENWYNKDNGYTVAWNVKEVYTDSYGVTYMLKNDQTAIVIGYKNEVSDVVIGVEGYTVTEIAKNAFIDCTNLNSITILDGVVKIGDGAFQNCYYLTSVTLPATLTTIGSQAFCNTGIQTLVIPNSVTKIGEYAFADIDNLTSVTLSNALTVIENYAFQSCNNLQSVVIPEGVTKIGDYAFRYCYNLSAVSLPSTLTSIGTYAFYDASAQSILIPESVTYIGEYAFTSGTIYVIASEKPEDWSSTWNSDGRQDYVAWGIKGYMTDEYGVTYVKFADDSVAIIGVSGIVSEIVLGGHADYPVTEIPARLLYNRGDITKVTLAEGITKIGEYAFFGCGSLAEIVFPSTLTEIETYAFANGNGRHVIVPASITTIGYCAFSDNNLYVTAAEAPEGWDSNWYGHSSSSIIWSAPNGTFHTDQTTGHTYLLAEDGWAHLYRFDLIEEITIAGVEDYKVVVHGGFGQYNSTVKKLTLLEGVVKVDAEAFRDYYYLKTLVLPETLEEIGAYAFYQTAIGTLIMPESVTTIGDRAFNSGHILAVADAKPAGWHDTWYAGETINAYWGFEEFYKDTETGITYALTKDGYAYTFNYDSSKTEIVIGAVEGYKVVVTSIFRNNYTVEKVTLAEGVVEIADHAFRNCPNLIEINFPASLKTIGVSAFNECGNLQEIELPATLESIGNSAFANGNNRHVYVPATIPTIGEAAFAGNLVYVQSDKAPVGWHVNWYGYSSNTIVWNAPAGTFYTDETYGNTYLLTDDGWAHLYRYDADQSELTIAGVEGYKVVVHGGYVDYYWALQKVTLLEGVVKLDDKAFYDQNNLTQVVLPKSLEEIGKEAFYSVDSLSGLVIPTTVLKIGENAFNRGKILVVAEERPEDWHENWYTGSSDNVFWNFKEFYTDETTGIKYALTNDGYAYTYGYNSGKSELTISGIEGYKVVITNIFNYNGNLKKVTLGEGVVEIAAGAFSNCSALEEINFPESLTTIGARAFNSTALNEIQIPVTVTTMGAYAFGCETIYPMTSTKPAGWDDYWFGGDSMNVFWNFKEFYVDETYGVTYVLHNDGTASIYSFDGSVTEVVIGIDGVTVVGMYPGVFQGTSVLAVTLPEGLTLISANAFSNCTSLETINIPSTVKYIDRYAFHQCQKLAEIDIPEGVTKIGSHAFYYCTKLQLLTLPSTLTEIGDSAFYNCYSLEELTLPEGLVTIDAQAFYNCSRLNTVITIPSTVTSIGSNAFWSIGDASIVIVPADVTYIGNYAIAGRFVLTGATQVQPEWDEHWCSDTPERVIWNFKELFTDAQGVTYALRNDMTAIVVGYDGTAVDVVLAAPDGYTLTGIAARAFYDCDELETIKIPNGITVIGEYTFNSCNNLYSVTLPESLTEIKYSAFYNCSKLTEIVIPEGVTRIGDNAFWDCYQLQFLTLPSTLTTIGSYAFRNCYDLVEIVIPDSVTRIDAYAFNSCGNAVVIIPDSVTSMGEYAFSGKAVYVQHAEAPKGWSKQWRGDTSASAVWNFKEFYTDDQGVIYVLLNDNTAIVHGFEGDGKDIVLGLQDYVVTEIANGAFRDCDTIESIFIPEGVTKIGNDAFYSCNALAEISLPTTLTEIGSHAFYDCDALTSIEIPDSVTTLSAYAFYDCYALTSVVIGNGVTVIAEGVFSSCSNLKSISLPSTLTEIGNYAFNYCYSLESIVIPEGVTKIGDRAFYDCNKLKSVSLPGTLTKIGAYAFYSIAADYVAIPASVTTIGEHAFNRGIIYVPTASKPSGWTTNWNGSDRAKYVAWNFKEFYTDEQGVTYALFTDDTATVVGFTGKQANLTLAVEGYAITAIADRAFYAANIVSITIPNTVTSIGQYAFYGVSGNPIVMIPDSVTTIGSTAFNTCKVLYSGTEAPEGWSSNWHSSSHRVTWNVKEFLTDAYGVTYVKLNDDTVFIANVDGSVSEIVLGGVENFPVSEIPEYLLNGRNDITKVTLDPSITTIGSYAFSNTYCHVIIPETVTSVGSYAFNNCYAYVMATERPDGWYDGWNGYNSHRAWGVPAGTLYTNESGVTYLLCEDMTAHLYFFDTSSAELTIQGVDGYEVTVYGNGNGNWSVEKLVLEEGVAKIADYAFQSWHSLTEIVFPESLIEIGAYAFYNTNLNGAALILPDHFDVVGENAFSASMVLLKAETKPNNWNDYWYSGTATNVYWDYKDIYTDENGISYVLTNHGLAYAYAYTGDGTEITIGGLEIDEVSYDVIVRSAFRENGTIQKVTLLDGVICVDDLAFYNCNSLAEVILPSTLTEIGDQAFSDCGALTTVVLPASVVTVGQYAFSYTNAHVFVPTSVTTVGYFAFNSCKIYVEASQTQTPEGWDDGWTGWNAETVYNVPTGSFYVNENGVVYVLCEDKTAHLYFFDDGSEELTIRGVAGYGVIVHGDRNGNWSVKKLIIGEGITKIDAYAFDNWNYLEEISLPSTLTEIGEYAFPYAQLYNSCIVIPESVTTMSASAFRSGIMLSTLTEQPEGWSDGWYSGNARNVYMNFKEVVEVNDGLYVVTNDGLAYLAAYTGDMTEVVIGGVDGCKVIVHDNFFESNRNIQKVTVLDGVSKIGAHAFYGCTNLKEISLPSTLEEIGTYAFYNAPLDKPTIPASVTTIGYYAFSCESIYPMINSKPDTWDTNWYNGSADQIFWNMLKLVYDETTGITYVLHADGKTASIYSFDGTVTEIVIGSLEYVNEDDGQTYTYTITDIYPGVFAGASITSITLPEGLVEIGANAFNNCTSLETVVLPSTLTKIGANAFYYCTSLVEIEIPEGVTEIGAYAFYNCTKLATVSLPSTLEKIGNYAFYNCYALKSLELPDSVSMIGTKAFQNCSNLKLTALPASLTSIGQNAFSSVQFEKYVIIPAGVTTIGYNAMNGYFAVAAAEAPETWDSYWNGGNTSVIWNVASIYEDEANGTTYALRNDMTAVLISFDDSVETFTLGVEGFELTEIAARAFYECQLTEIVIPEGVTKIGENAFYNCRYLESLTLPSTLAEIGSYAFYDCDKLTAIEIPGNVSVIGDFAFYNCGALESIVICDGTATIGSNAFSYCYALKSVVIGEGITAIGSSAFYNCYNMTTVTLPGTLTEIGSHAFQHCNSLKDVNIPEGVTTIGEFAFSYCYSLADLTLPNSLTEIGRYAFCDTNLKHVVIPEGVTVIGENAFGNGVVYVSHAKKLDGWHKNWNGSDRKDYVAWNFKEFYTDDQGIIYALFNDNTASAIGYTGEISEIVIGLENYTVTQIAHNAFRDCSTLKSVVVSYGVTKIGERAFYNCDALTTVTLPTTLTKISSYAFADCNAIESIVIPNGITKIDAYAFENCSALRELLLPTTLTEIGEYAFGYCGSLESVTIPEGTVTIGARAFYNCYKLREVVLPSTLTTIGEYAFSSTNLKNTVIPTSVTSIGEHALPTGMIFVYSDTLPDTWDENWNGSRTGFTVYGFEAFYTDEQYVVYALRNDKTALVIDYYGNTTDLVLSVDGYTITEIAHRAFYNNEAVETIVIPEGVTKIGLEAFAECRYLKQVTLPSTLTHIDAHAFQNCYNLTGIEMPDSVVSIGAYAFQNCSSMSTLKLSGSLLEIGAYAFQNCSALTEVTFPSTLTKIGEYAFGHCYNLTSVTIPGSVTTIEPHAFYYCNKLESVTIEEGVTTIGYRAFMDCYALKSLSLPSTLTEIGDYAFYRCSCLESVTIPGKVLRIGEYAFAYNQELTQVSLPMSLIEIDDRAFYGCNSLESVTIPESVTTIGQYAFSHGIIYIHTKQVPIGWHAKWNSDDRKDFVVFGFQQFYTDEATGIVYALNADKTAVVVGYTGTPTEVVLGLDGYTITKIAYRAFYDCKTLTSIVIPEGVTVIGEDAFYNCSALTTVSLPSTLSEIGNRAFGYTAVSEIKLPAALTLIGNEAFYNCDALTSIEIPGTVTTIGERAFYNCDMLESVIICDGVKEIKTQAFCFCSNLTAIYVPASVQTIGSAALGLHTSGVIYVTASAKPAGWDNYWASTYGEIVWSYTGA